MPKILPKGGRTMLYFVKENHVHRYPVPKQCRTRYDHEILRDTIPHSTDECVYCLHPWPGEEGDLL